MNATSAKKTRKVRRPLSDEELIQIALDRFAPMSQGLAPRQISQLAKDYHRDPAVVQRAIVSAFARKLVAVDRLEYPLPSFNHELENDLRKRFPLQKAIVVGTLPVGRGSADKERALWEDRVHDELGKAVAHFVSTGIVIRDGDRVGIGSGRGVFSFSRWLSYYERQRAKNVTAISLTGDVYARSHSWWKSNVTSIGVEGLNCQLDADDHLNLLGLSFEQQLHMVNISNSIAWDEDELETRIRQTVLNEEQWERIVPNLGFIGVGVLSSGHRLYEEAVGPVERQEDRLRPIIKDLIELVQLNRSIETGNVPYVAVGDICNRLFFVKPPNGLRISDQVETRIQSLIDSINKRLLTPTIRQLKQIGTLILIAGTRKKGYAIKQLLEEGEYNIRTLCVDEEAASVILASK